MVAVRRDDDGGAEFLGKVPVLIRNAIAREFDLDLPLFHAWNSRRCQSSHFDAEFNIDWLVTARECDRLKESNYKL